MQRRQRGQRAQRWRLWAAALALALAGCVVNPVPTPGSVDKGAGFDNDGKANDATRTGGAADAGAGGYSDAQGADAAAPAEDVTPSGDSDAGQDAAPADGGGNRPVDAG